MCTSKQEQQERKQELSKHLEPLLLKEVDKSYQNIEKWKKIILYKVQPNHAKIAKVQEFIED